MKYLKNFQTNADYQAFKSSEEYVEPNVFRIEENSSVVYNAANNDAEDISLITFTVKLGGDGFTKEYTAEEGMTWEQWINSGKYDISNRLGQMTLQLAQLTTGPNAGKYIYAINCVSDTYSSYYHIYKPNNGGVCSSTDIIENGVTYTAQGEK